MRKTLGSVKPIGEQNIIRLAIRLIAGGSITIAMGFLTSCSSVEYAPESAPRMIVVNEGAAFFIQGPAQTGGADRTLPGGNEVKVLRKDFGYSVVQLGDGEQGYVDNEALIPSPYTTSPPAEVHPIRKRKNPPVAGKLPAFRY